MALVGPKRTRRTNNRLAKLRLSNPGSLAGVKADNSYTPREARAVFSASRKQKAKKPKPKAAYNPLAPLTGKNEKLEMDAAEQLRFGPQAAALKSATGINAQTTVNRAKYFDDWQNALREATTRVQGINQQNVAAGQARTDTAYTQDKAAVAARDAQASATAANLGRGPVQSIEGAQAVESQRAAGNQAVGLSGERMASDTKDFALRMANAGLKKIEDQGRQESKRKQLLTDEGNLAKDRGAFRVDQRARNRQSERTWAATQKEFGLKQQDVLLKNKATAADRSVELKKVAAQKIVAALYSSASMAKARAQVRVAKLQLDKGKIDQNQYRHIVNEYKGLKNKKPSGSGSGSLQTWEVDKIDTAVTSLSKNKVPLSKRATWIAHAQSVGLPLRLANIAWRRHAKTFTDLGVGRN